MEWFSGSMAVASAIVGVMAIGGWVLTTWLRVRHGYPLEGTWGQTIYPKSSEESAERIKLLASENAQLKAELGSVKDRLETIERIVTDRGPMLAQEIEQLRVGRN